MIPLDLLRSTESRAPGICVYGGAGKRKTNAAYTLPSPVLFLDFDGGTSSIAPWIRRKRQSDQATWVEYTQEQREQVLTLVRPEVRSSIVRKPGPLVDVISFDTLRGQSYVEFSAIVGNFNAAEYNSIVLDSLKEFNFDVQTFSKGGSTEPMQLNLWSGVQERCAIALRMLKNLRDRGVFIYLIGTEAIDKDYVTDPRSSPRGAQPEVPYSISASVDVPGKMVGAVQHVVDILLHARVQNREPVWMARPEPLPSGNCSWESKDRFGRLPDACPPNFHAICAYLYGKETTERIYGASPSTAS